MRLLSLISVLAVVVAVCCLSLPSPVRALTIQFDYTYDGGFFTDPLVNPQASEAKAALERAGKDFEMLVDNLTRIEHSDAQQNTWEAGFRRPDTGDWHWEPNVVVPAATLIVYVGGRSIGAGTLASGGPGGAVFTYTTLEWFETITTRGQPGAAAGAEIDFGPWGGSIVFNSTSDWHYHTVAPPMGSEADFLSTAVHELCHVLGYGTSASWDNRIPAGSLLFTGEAARAVYGGDVPMNNETGQFGPRHWAPGIESIVGTVDVQEAAMDPNLTAGTRKRLTELDIAGLIDIGWQMPLPGDADHDGEVEYDDYIAARDGFGSPGSWADGDSDFDGDVDVYDYLALKRHFGMILTGQAEPLPPGVGAVPEPTGLVILLAGAGAVFGRARRRRRGR